MASQNFKRNLFLNLHRKGGKILTLVICFHLPLKREIKKKSLTLAAYFLPFETPGVPALTSHQYQSVYILNKNYQTLRWKQYIQNHNVGFLTHFLQKLRDWKLSKDTEKQDKLVQDKNQHGSWGDQIGEQMREDCQTFTSKGLRE